MGRPGCLQLTQGLCEVRYEFRKLKRQFSLILFVDNLMIDYSKENRENCLGKCFVVIKKRNPDLNLTPELTLFGLIDARQPDILDVLHSCFAQILRTASIEKKILSDANLSTSKHIQGETKLLPCNLPHVTEVK